MKPIGAVVKICFVKKLKDRHHKTRDRAEIPTPIPTANEMEFFVIKHSIHFVLGLLNHYTYKQVPFKFVLLRFLTFFDDNLFAAILRAEFVTSLTAQYLSTTRKDSL